MLYIQATEEPKLKLTANWSSLTENLLHRSTYFGVTPLYHHKELGAVQMSFQPEKFITYLCNSKHTGYDVFMSMTLERRLLNQRTPVTSGTPYFLILFEHNHLPFRN